MCWNEFGRSRFPKPRLLGNYFVGEMTSIIQLASSVVAVNVKPSPAVQLPFPAGWFHLGTGISLLWNLATWIFIAAHPGAHPESGQSPLETRLTKTHEDSGSNTVLLKDEAVSAISVYLLTGLRAAVVKLGPHPAMSSTNVAANSSAIDPPRSQGPIL